MALNQASTDLIKEFEGRDYTALNRRLVVARSCTKHCLPLSPNQDNPAVSTAFGFAAGATGLFHHVVQNCVLAVFFNEQGNRHLGGMATGAFKRNMVVGYGLQFSHTNECRASGRVDLCFWVILYVFYNPKYALPVAQIDKPTTPHTPPVFGVFLPHAFLGLCLTCIQFAL